MEHGSRNRALGKPRERLGGLGRSPKEKNKAPFPEGRPRQRPVAFHVTERRFRAGGELEAPAAR
jgi:hypothetical protein